MAKFEFRLKKVLEYRRMAEDWAKTDFLEAQGKLLAAENELRAIQAQREQMSQADVQSIEDLRTLGQYLERLDDQERMQHTIVSIVRDEVDNARNVWFEKRQDAQAMQKLHDAQFDEYSLNELRREQAELDELSQRKRAA